MISRSFFLLKTFSSDNERENAKKKFKVEAQNGKPLSELNGNQNGVKKRRGRPPKSKVEAKPESPPKPTTFIPSGIRWAESDFITNFMNKIFQSEHLNPEHRPFLVISQNKNNLQIF